MSRHIEDLTPEMQAKYHEFDAAMIAKSLPYQITCTYRPQEEQDRLYAQGRTAPGPIVTKVRHSEHTRRTAFDIVMLDVSGRPVWAPSAYVAAGEVGESVGLTWGGDWDGDGRSDDERFVDMPHFQLKTA